jgi:hypothetical protein
MEKKWKRFEDLAAHIQKTLAPGASVEQNVHIKGKTSGVERQIDIAVRTRAGQFDLFVAIDCKDYKVKVDVKDVEAFATMLKDVEANKGALVAANGFTPAAKRVAKDAGISLFGLVDAESEDWPSFISIPVLVDDRHLQSVQYGISSYELRSFRIEGIELTSVFRKDGTRIGPLRDLVSKRWNDGRFPVKEGRHERLALSEEPTYVRDGDQLSLVEFTATIKVRRTLYFGHLPLVQVQGFQDAHTGVVHTRAITTDWLDWKTDRAKWEVVASEEVLAVTPVMKLEEHTHFPLEGESEDTKEGTP